MEHSPWEDDAHPSTYEFHLHLTNPEVHCFGPYPAQAEANV